MFKNPRMMFVTVLMSMMLISSTTRAQDEFVQAGNEDGAETKRDWGFGTRLGVGYLGGGFPGSGGSSYTTGTGVKLALPTLDFRYFFEGGNSFDISWGIVPTVLVAGLAKAFYFDPYLSYSFNFGKGSKRFSIAPGLRGIIGAGNGKVVGAIRVPVNLAVEFLCSGRGFGFQIFARPYFHLQPGDQTAVGGGVMGGIAFFGYKTS